MTSPHIHTFAASPSVPAAGARRILIVDNDAGILDLETLVLERAGHQVDRASDGESGWQALQLRNYDLLLTDNEMPGTSGITLVRKLRLAKMELPVVMASGSLEAIDDQQLEQACIDLFLPKPFTIHQLLTTVHRALTLLNGDGPTGLAGGCDPTSQGHHAPWAGPAAQPKWCYARYGWRNAPVQTSLPTGCPN